MSLAFSPPLSKKTRAYNFPLFWPDFYYANLVRLLACYMAIKTNKTSSVFGSLSFVSPAVHWENLLKTGWHIQTTAGVRTKESKCQISCILKEK